MKTPRRSIDQNMAGSGGAAAVTSVPEPHRSATRARFAGFMVLGAALLASAGASGACGYDNPQTMSRGFLNWIYPDSLHVVGAISRDVAARRLPLANFYRGGPDMFGQRFRLAKTSLERFGDMLHALAPEKLPRPVSLILVEPMLWARFEPSAGGVKTGVHVSGAGRGDLVLVSGEAVISEIAARRLTFRQAVERGLMRLYGSQSQITGFRSHFDQVGSDPSDALEASDASPAAAAARFRFAKRLSCPASENPTDRGCTPDRP